MKERGGSGAVAGLVAESLEQRLEAHGQGAPDAPVEPLVGGGGAGGGLAAGGLVVVPPPPPDPPFDDAGPAEDATGRDRRQGHAGGDGRAQPFDGLDRAVDGREALVKLVQAGDDRVEAPERGVVLLPRLLELVGQGVVVAAERMDGDLDRISVGHQGPIGFDLEARGQEERGGVDARRDPDRDGDVIWAPGLGALRLRALRLGRLRLGPPRVRRTIPRLLGLGHGTTTEAVFVAAATLVSLSCLVRQYARYHIRPDGGPASVALVPPPVPTVATVVSWSSGG